MLSFDDRVALVTGAGRGMGRAHALLLASRGAKLVVSDLGCDLSGHGKDAGPSESVVAEIRAAGGEAVAHAGDLATVEGSEAAIAAALDAFGGLDILIHNAGIALEPAAVTDETVERFHQLLSINAQAALVMIRKVWPTMIERGGGNIVIIGSSAALGVANHTTYAIGKSALIGLTRSLAEEGGEFGIKVNAVEPVALTRMASGRILDQRFLEWFEEKMRPELVSAAVGYLSHQSCPLSGEILIAGGGRVARRVIAETTGIIDENLTIERVGENIAQIFDAGTLHYPDPNQQGATQARLLGYQRELVEKLT